MLAYRPTIVRADRRPLTSELVAAIAADAIDPRHFRAAPGLSLRWHERDEEPFWELFCGRALDRSQTRERRQFRSWWLALADGDAGEPLIAVRWDRGEKAIHVTRSILCRIHEGYDSGGGVFETRVAMKWVRELVGTIALDEITSAGRLRDELAGLIHAAVVGTSRLPLTSVESPLPQFTLGQLAYCYAPNASSTLSRFADATLSPWEAAKSLEGALRFAEPEQIDELALQFPDADHGFNRLLAVFNSVSLTPYTDFVGKSLSFAAALGRHRPDLHADFLARLTLLIDRHLCAYDLVQFHHRGANYPDALMLVELWPRLLERASPERLQSRRFRRAVRHALLLRLEYEGLRVPDRPTSIGDNARILPPPFSPLDDEQIHAPTRRPRRLFNEPWPDNPGIWAVLDDLDDPAELQELGVALFLHRPFGFAKNPAEPDHTPLVSHRLNSKWVAERRLRALARHADRIGGKPVIERWFSCLLELPIAGVPLRAYGGSPKPGVVSLHDAAQSADDWIARSTTRSSLRDIAAAFDWSEPMSWRLLLPDPDGDPNQLAAFDQSHRTVARLVMDASEGYVRRGGLELPRAGVRIHWFDGNGSSQRFGVVRPALADELS